MQFPGTPQLNTVVQEPDAHAYFLDIGDGELTLHIHAYDQHLSVEQLRRYYERFLTLAVLLEERGMKRIRTMVEQDNVRQQRLAEFFGFFHTGVTNHITLSNGTEYHMDEMEFTLDGS